MATLGSDETELINGLMCKLEWISAYNFFIAGDTILYCILQVLVYVNVNYIEAFNIDYMKTWEIT